MEPINTLAKRVAGNYTHFENFMSGLDDHEIDPARWGIVYTSNRDADDLTMSNAAIIANELETFGEGQVQPYSASHWAVGYVDGHLLRVYDSNGAITPAFAKWYELQARMEQYPVLDEEDYFQRQDKHAREYWKFMSTQEKVELLKRFQINPHLRDYYKVMRADDGGLWDYLTTD